MISKTKFQQLSKKPASELTEQESKDIAEYQEHLDAQEAEALLKEQQQSSTSTSTNSTRMRITEKVDMQALLAANAKRANESQSLLESAVILSVSGFAPTSNGLKRNFVVTKGHGNFIMFAEGIKNLPTFIDPKKGHEAILTLSPTRYVNREGKTITDINCSQCAFKEDTERMLTFIKALPSGASLFGNI